jgi:chromosome segregation ATPase
MTNNDEVVFESGSGISIEEQKEILSKINGIAEKNRRRLSQGFEQDVKYGEKIQVKAKKKDVLFPLAVNIAAVLLLSAGGFFLLSFFGKMDAQVREGSAVYNLTERALIEEIRKDTAEKIASKEIEISSILSRLEDVDVQLSLLYSSNQELTSEQLVSQERLLKMQNSYRSDLSSLQEERSQILEASRSRESKLRAQLEERNREFSAAQLKTSGELDYAVSELDRLTNEQEKNAAIDAQFSGALASISVMIQEGQYDQASQLIKNLRFFLNNSVTASVRLFQARKEFYVQAINSMEIIIEDALKYRGTDEWDAQLKIIQLEETISDMEKTIAGFNAGSSGQISRIAELEASVSSLRTANSSLETGATEKDRTIRTLESERVNLNQTVASRDNTVKELQTSNAAYEQEIASLRNQLAIIRQALE